MNLSFSSLRSSLPVAKAACGCSFSSLRCEPVTKAKTARKLKAGAADIARLNALTDKYGRSINRAFIGAVRALKSNFPLNDVADALKAGNLSKAKDLIEGALVRSGFTSMVEEFNDAVIQGAKFSSKMVTAQFLEDGGAPLAASFHFNVANPKTAEFLTNYAGNRIREISDKTREALNGVLTQGFMDGRNPLTVARDVRGSIGLTETQTEHVRSFRNVLEGNGNLSDYLSRELRDARFDSVVARALKDGEPLAQEKIDQIVERYQTNYVAYRADTIGRTEGIRGVSAGSYEVWASASTEGRIPEDFEVKRYWVFTNDGKQREAHAEIPDMNPRGVGIDEPFDTPLGPLMYPGDPDGDPENTINCRCTVIYQMEPKRREASTGELGDEGPRLGSTSFGFRLRG